MLTLSGITKHFKGIRALQPLDLEVKIGQIHGLIGPNGAGKTTVINVAAGLYKPDSGSVYLKGVDITRAPVFRRARMGLARTYQSARLFDDMSVLENTRVSMEAGAGHQVAAKRTLDELESLGLGRLARTDVRDLPHGTRKILEVALAISRNPAVLLLDEPAAGLDAEEIEVLISLLQNRRQSHAVLLVEHNMDLVMRICDPITVLDAGAFLVSGSASQVARDASVIEAYLGSA